MKYSISYVLGQSFPGRKWSISNDDYKTLVFHDDLPAITLQQILIADDLLDKTDTANAYKKHRAAEYPAIVDQLDMLWHSMDSGEIPKSGLFYESVKTVKDKYPRGN